VAGDVRTRLAIALATAGAASLRNPAWSTMSGDERLEMLERAGELLPLLRQGDMVLLPTDNLVRLRHEATKRNRGVDPATFAQMMHNLIDFARSQEG